MTESELKGQQQIMFGIANNGWMLYQTDKSSKLCLDTVDNYVYCMRSHVINDPIVTPEDVRKGEMIMNNHTRQWVRICKIGSNQGQTWRVNRALITTYSTIPILTGLRKDHKGD